MIVGVGTPAQFLHVTDQGGHDVEVAVEGAKVVAWLAGIIEGIPRNVLPILVLLEQHELRFHADVEDITFLAEAFELARQNRTGTEGPRLPVYV